MCVSFLWKEHNGKLYHDDGSSFRRKNLSCDIRNARSVHILIQMKPQSHCVGFTVASTMEWAASYQTLTHLFRDGVSF
eukprot:COSAG02_NODE_649_length_18914_cov_30.645868_9_plen_78_part_00